MCESLGSLEVSYLLFNHPVDAHMKRMLSVSELTRFSDLRNLLVRHLSESTPIYLV